MGKKSISKLRKIASSTPSSDATKSTSDTENIDHETIDEHVKHGNVNECNNEAEVDHDNDQGIEKVVKRKRVRKRKAAAVSTDDKELKVDTPAPSSEPSSSAANRFTNSCTVYIEGLPFDAAESDISKFFESAGPIQSLRLPRWHDSGRLRGYGHVEFADEESAQRAMDMNGSYMGKRFIKVDRPMTPRLLQQQQKGAAHTTRPPGCRTIFVKNLPYDCEEEDVTKAFMFCGKIAKVRLAVWGHTNQLKGFGYVDFKSEESAEIAVKKSLSSEGIAVKGRPTICDFETGQPKGSFKPRQK